MDIRITSKKLSGAVTPPPSKSMAHRLLLAAALAEGVSTIEHVAFSQDIEATLRCMEALGCRWEQLEGDRVRVTGIGGNMMGPMLCKLFGITDEIAQGVAFGTAAHVIGTAKANELSELTGAASSLSLVVAGLLTAVFMPMIVNLW